LFLGVTQSRLVATGISGQPVPPIFKGQAALLHSVGWWLATAISVQTIGTIFRVKTLKP